MIHHLNGYGKRCLLPDVPSEYERVIQVIRGTRVQADAVIENYEAGESVDEIAYNFDPRPEDIEKVLAFAASRQTATPH